MDPKHRSEHIPLIEKNRMEGQKSDVWMNIHSYEHADGDTELLLTD